MAATESRRQIDAQSPDGLFMPGREKGFGLIKFFENPAARQQESLARSRTVDAPRRSVQQLQTETGFQPRYAFADCRPGNSERPGRPSQAAEVDGGDKLTNSGKTVIRH
ncbi:MAG TPA: hypothetical protein VGL08_06520 [Paraburkholderia sp.]